MNKTGFACFIHLQQLLTLHPPGSQHFELALQLNLNAWPSFASFKIKLLFNALWTLPPELHYLLILVVRNSSVIWIVVSLTTAGACSRSCLSVLSAVMFGSPLFTVCASCLCLPLYRKTSVICEEISLHPLHQFFQDVLKYKQKC